jgi:4-amino-4-deoxy-L-arabinose transferase-like glycosyltransferase
VFLAATAWIAAGAAGPGLTWDEPAYRNSQVRLQEWWRQRPPLHSTSDLARPYSRDEIDFYWEFNRHGPNFHPPMGSYLNLASHALFGSWVDELTSRRWASCLELAATAALLCHFLGRRFGLAVGLFAAASLATLPRLLGDAHLVGTDIPMTMFWTAAALAFWNGLERRTWQWAFGCLAGCLFLSKFSGAAIVLPLAVAFLAYFFRVGTRKLFLRWSLWSLAFAGPLVPLAAAVHFGAQGSAVESWLLNAFVDSSGWLSLLLLWPVVPLLAHARSDKPPDWPAGLETPWVLLASAPLTAVALNPTWWHDPAAGLANYWQLNLGRKEHLPDIAIYYLGRQYIYSLPWHNAWVLMAATIPFGTLGLGLAGIARSLARRRSEPLGLYFLLHVAALPVLRMFGTPAHDGVRLFLPTFVFWSALAGLGAGWIASRWKSPLAYAPLLAVGPVWAGVEAVRAHPYELSYYNIGLRAAQRCGFEVSYWYDAVTPDVLAELNQRLPNGAVLAFPSPSVNPEVFLEYQSKGRLRGDVVLDAAQASGFPYFLLLTHSSKSTPFSRLLYAMTPWLSREFQGVRLFSIVDPGAAAVAWALHAMATQYERSPEGGVREKPDSAILNADPADLLRAGEWIAKRGRAATGPDDQPPAAAHLARRWLADPNLAKVLAIDPDAVRKAARILASRRPDVWILIEAEGYPPDDDWGGRLDAQKSE